MVNVLNNILAQKEVMVSNKEGIYKMVSAQSEAGMNYKLGVCDSIEYLLHNSNSYRGYRYLYGNAPGCKFDRYYY